MSTRLVKLVLGTQRFGPERIGPFRRLVMIALAERASDEEAACYPGLEDIAARTELGLSTVKRVLAGLVAEGWLSAVKRPGYGTLYRLNVEQLQQRQRETRELKRLSRLSASQPVTGQLPTGQPVSDPLAGPPEGLSWPVSPLPIKKNLLNQKATLAPKGAGKPVAVKVPDARHQPCRELVAAFQRRLKLPDTWSGREAGALSQLLKATPSLTPEVFAQWLDNLATSVDGKRADPPYTWLPKLQGYSEGPRDRFARTMATTTQGRPKSLAEKLAGAA